MNFSYFVQVLGKKAHISVHFDLNDTENSLYVYSNASQRRQTPNPPPFNFRIKGPKTRRVLYV